MTKQNRFSALGSALKGDVLPEQEDNLSDVSAIPAKKNRARGKRSNPDYEQVGAYIPKSLNRQVKKLLFDEEGVDFSDLVTTLLEDWVSEKSK